MSSKDSSSAVGDMSRRMVCGGIAGMIAKTITNPLDRIRMLAQTGEHGGGGKITFIDLYRKIIQKEGIIGLWAGNGVNLLRVFPAKAVVFSSNDFYRQWLRQFFSIQDNNKSLDGGLSFLSGGLSGITASAVTYPMDLARGRISGKLATSATKKKDYSGLTRTIVLTVREEGVLALYRGVTPTLLGAMPYEGIKFGTVGVMETYMLKEGEQPSFFQKMCFGGMGGVMAGLITYPNDTIRRLLQLQGSRGTEAKYDGYMDCVRQTYRAHGIQRFYRGVLVNIIRMAPNTAIQFGSYEVLKQYTSGLL